MPNTPKPKDLEKLKAWAEAWPRFSYNHEINKAVLALIAIAEETGNPSPEAGSDWVMVPREPTEAMKKAAWDLMGDAYQRSRTNLSDAYRAMLSAAPPVQPKEEGNALEIGEQLVAAKKAGAKEAAEYRFEELTRCIGSSGASWGVADWDDIRDFIRLAGQAFAEKQRLSQPKAGDEEPVAGHKVHVLKTHPGPFAAIRARKKWLEIRKADRPFEEGDTLWLDEYAPAAVEQSGQVEIRFISHVLPGGQYGIEPGYVALSLTEAPLAKVAAPFSEIGREEIARVIDPEAWEFFDRHKANPVMKAEIAHETRASLAKADAILSLSPASRSQTPLSNGWRDIASAPKDGSTVLVAHASNRAIFTVSWDADASGWVDGSTDRYDDLQTFDPSHWMPLPAAPTPSEPPHSGGGEG